MRVTFDVIGEPTGFVFMTLEMAGKSVRHRLYGAYGQRVADFLATFIEEMTE